MGTFIVGNDMSFIRRLFSSASDAMPSSSTALRFPEENLLATAAQGDGFFITRPGALLKGNRYKIIRKLGRGRCSNTFLVEDLQSSLSSNKFLAAKILSADSTNALKNGLIHELEFLQAVADRPHGTPEPLLPILHDHFAQKGLHGVHYCFLTSPLRSHVHAFRASAPTGKLLVHIVKPIIACVVDALQVLHSRNIIHADIKADNLLFLGPDTAEIEETIARDPPLVDGTFTFNDTEYPILRSQPFQPKISWNATPFIAETIQVVLSDLGVALWADRPKPPGDIGAFALRAPENIIRAECGKEIDIWAIGCMTYELLAGEILFQPQSIPDLTPDESLLLLQVAVTGETLSKDVIDQSRVKDKYFNREGALIHSRKNAYSRQSVKERLTKQCHGDLTEIQINAAARFINDCLRLNPHDRLTIDQLALHSWLETAFMGGMDEEHPPGAANIPPLPNPTPAPAL
ncbi:hypothetical protein Clacol_009285 [Clathrus columnatus]|uniref:non-specific serine/threonine protein kinase n=1 Tax=Clathrus columnatus TaxID=1419009 RepID=A0AAV5AMQ9_9AGAM|nr:hypothetical protein Clacol_009285 [Clathrus columnatus]